MRLSGCCSSTSPHICSLIAFSSSTTAISKIHHLNPYRHSLKDRYLSFYIGRNFPFFGRRERNGHFSGTNGKLSKDASMSVVCFLSKGRTHAFPWSAQTMTARVAPQKFAPFPVFASPSLPWTAIRRTGWRLAAVGARALGLGRRLFGRAGHPAAVRTKKSAGEP